MCVLQVDSDKEKASEGGKSEVESDAESVSKMGRVLFLFSVA